MTQYFGDIKQDEQSKKDIDEMLHYVAAMFFQTAPEGTFGVELNDTSEIDIDTKLTLRKFLPKDSRGMGSQADVERTESLDALLQLGFAPTDQQYLALKMDVDGKKATGYCVMRETGQDSGSATTLSFSECALDSSVADMLSAVATNKMENLAWVEYFPSKGIIGTINGEWYIAPSSYGTLGLEGTVAKFDAQWLSQFDSRPSAEDSPQV